MRVKRIVANIDTRDVLAAKAFYADLLGLDVVMDLGWITTYGSTAQMAVQISVAEQGGSGTVTPDFSIEVDDLEEAIRRMRGAERPIEYGPVDEPWGVRRFFVRDPFGRLLNILEHAH